MRRNEFTQVPIKKQTVEKNPNELDIEFLDYQEVGTQTRPKTARTRQQAGQTPRGTGERRRQPQQAGRSKQAGQTARTARPAQQSRSTKPSGQAPKRPVAKDARTTQQRQTVRQGKTAAARGTARPTAARPEPRLQHPAQTPAKVARPLRGQRKDPDIEFFDYEEKKTKAPAKKSRFKKGLLIAWLAFCAILAAALVLLFVFLSNYERSRPSDMIHRIVSAVEKGDLDDLHLKTEDGTLLTDGQILADPQEIASYILQKGADEEDGGITFRVVNAESDENHKVYLIKAGDKKILKTVIERSEKEYAFGFTGWQEKETILLSDAFPVTKLRMQIPQSDQLMVNGRTIGREYLVSEGDRINLLSRLISEGFISEQPTTDTYEIPGIFFQKEVKATDPSGRTYDCILTGDTYAGGFDAPQEFIDEQYDRVIEMFEPYAFYFSGESGQGELARIMIDDSPAYNSATSADVSWMQEHSDVEITEEKAENFKKYSDDCFSCDISFLQTIYQDDDPVKTWDTNMTWVFVRDDEDFYIADFVTRAADEG